METITHELKVTGVSEEIGLSIKEEFLPFFEQAEEWKLKAEGLIVSDVSQKEEMKQAREARLALKNIRVGVERKRKDLKEESLMKGKAIDGVANVIKFLISPIEKHLQEQEDFIKIEEERIKTELKESRESELIKYDVNTEFYNLKEMPEESYSQLLGNSKIAFQQKKDAELKAEKERIEKEKAELEEKDRIKKENEKLKAEAEAKAKEEAKRIAKEKAEIKAREEKERKEREAYELKIRKEREEKEKLEAKLLAKKRAEEKAELERLQKEKAEKEALEKAKKEARLAPDKIKLQRLAEEIIKITLPEVQSAEAKSILLNVQTLLNKTSNFIKEKTLEL